MILEKTVTVTSVTSGKNRVFETPIGRFTHQSVPLGCYRVWNEPLNQLKKTVSAKYELCYDFFNMLMTGFTGE